MVAPLANDTDPNGDVLTLTKVSTAPASTTLVPDLELGVVTFTGSQEGSYEFTYTVSDGPEAVVGVVRVDVVSGDEHAAPVAEDDIAILPSGGSALVAPLANDTDPPAASSSSSPSRSTLTRASRWPSSTATSCA